MREVLIVAAGDAWFKSSYSGAGATECVEAAFRKGGIAIRDSKDPDRAVLAFSACAWGEFVASVRREQV
ncbi:MULTISPECIES: DUF397 domain-containing protein [unclassified Streptomyces]|uniref:DUF397 domain-containing protein n=1 Tax=unclassified Streptomyces TaxID=2593676 RepID=UPI00336A354F